MPALPSQHSSAGPLPLAQLPAGLRAEVRRLQIVRPFANLVVLLFPAAWIAAVAIMQRWPAWPVRLVGVVVIGICLQAMGILMHEALHGNLFRRKRLDGWAGFLLAAPSGFSMAAYKVAHLNHHRHTRTERDQDDLSNYTRTRAQYVALFYSWFVIGTVVYMFFVPVKALQMASPAARRRILLEYALMLAAYAAVIAFAVRSGHVTWLLWYWLLPAQVATALSNVRTLAEHPGTHTEGDALGRTRTVTSNSVVSFLMLNLNYHLEHHLFPAVPWYNLPRLHTLLAPVYQGRKPEIQRSYLAYVLRSLRQAPERTG